MDPLIDYMDPLIDYMDILIDVPYRCHWSPYKFVDPILVSPYRFHGYRFHGSLYRFPLLISWILL